MDALRNHSSILDSSSIPRQLPNLVDRFADDRFRDVACDLNLAYFPWQNEVHDSLPGLLVRTQTLQNVRRLELHARQLAEANHRVRNASGRYTVQFAGGKRDVRGRDHAPRHSFSVEQLCITCLGFQRVSDRVAEIEHLPQPTLTFVGTNHRRLQAHGIGNYFFHHNRVAIQNRAAPVFEKLEQSWISNDAALQRLVKSGTILARRQRLQNVGINQHRARLMKSSEKILSRRKVDAGLSADRRIHLRQHGRWHLNDIHTAHVDGSQKPGHIADHAAAERNQGYATICALRYQFLCQLLQGCKTFRTLAIRHFEELGFNARGRKRLQQDLCPALPDRRDSDHKCAAAFKKFAEGFPGTTKQAASDEHFIRPRWRGDRDADHQHSS